jgi:hypothetical protein
VRRPPASEDVFASLPPSKDISSNTNSVPLKLTDPIEKSFRAKPNILLNVNLLKRTLLKDQKRNGNSNAFAVKFALGTRKSHIVRKEKFMNARVVVFGVTLNACLERKRN